MDETEIKLRAITPPIRVFIGHDHQEEIAYHVLHHSITRRATAPVSITPISRKHIESVFNRPTDEQQATEFSFSRFLVPYLCDYQGWALYMDCDMLVRCDLAELWADKGLRIMRYDAPQVMVVQHDYSPKLKTKFLDRPQKAYPKKNWSSLMLFNCAKCVNLTPEYVNKATGKQLHQFEWATNIGSLPFSYNHLVGEYQPNPEAKIVHWTNFGPWLNGHHREEFAAEWFDELRDMLYADGGR